MGSMVEGFVVKVGLSLEWKSLVLDACFQWHTTECENVCCFDTEFGRESSTSVDNMSSDQVLDAVKSLSLKSA